VTWREVAGAPTPTTAPGMARVPRQFLALARQAVAASACQRPGCWSPRTIATLHPSAVLRGQDEAEQTRLYAMLRDDLRLVAAAQ
jgi:hypothetical protein